MSSTFTIYLHKQFTNMLYHTFYMVDLEEHARTVIICVFK